MSLQAFQSWRGTLFPGSPDSGYLFRDFHLTLYYTPLTPEFVIATSGFPSLGRTFLAIALFGLGQFPASIFAEESTGSEPTAPRLLRDSVAIASAPLPDPTPKPVVLPPAVVLDTVELELHNLYRTDGHRLKLAHEIREKAIAERQAWLEANPPQPQDIIVRHWDVTPPAPESNPTVETEARP
jgi:hypothetical protein